METQYALCRKVLKRLDEAGVLSGLIIIGSWCRYFYQGYFTGVGYGPSIRTRDIDFLITPKIGSKRAVDVAALMEDFGFLVDFHRQGYMRLVHPELIIEFLVPERGRGSEGPVRVPQLGVQAQALRFLNLLTEQTISVTVDHITVRLPHPAAFALHKLLIAQRRTGKQAKERAEAYEVLQALAAKGESSVVRSLYRSLPARWQKRIRESLRSSPELQQIVLPNIHEKS
ncbi:MAG: hypothetical protein HY737_01290 [Candidatus Omnitrophica bacterium]|nr:hypothetical protein [Candidatus Omnitrophota bacterium]